MSFELNLPNFQVETQSERRMYAYLYQTVQQLNWAMKHLQAGEAAGQIEVYKGPAGASAAQMTPMENFSQIKSLIIKSADIIDAYYDSIRTKLEGVYVAQSEFGIFREQTALDLEANAKGISQNYSHIQNVSDNLTGLQANMGSVREDVLGVQDAVASVYGQMDDLQAEMGSFQTALTETRAYIKTGQIGEDERGIPVYGLEIGQTNEAGGVETFNKYARFSSSRLSFYDQNDIEVAYISDYKLYITNVHITGTLTIGNYEMDTSDGLTFRWIGG